MAKEALALAAAFFAVSNIATLSSAQPPTTPTSATAEAAISIQMDRWIAAFETGDAQALSAIFAADGVYAANNGQVLEGRENIGIGVQSWFEGPIGRAKQVTGGQLDVKQSALRFEISGDVAYNLMRFTIDLSPPGCVLDAGHALIIWRRQPDGVWLIDSFLGNQDKEPPPNPCHGP